MGIFSAGPGGEDTLQVRIAVFAIVLSLVVTMLVPILAPQYDSNTGYGWEQIYIEKMNLEGYTGESMTNMTPWVLSGVYTPWSIDLPVNVDPETGWVYGESINYSQDGFYTTTHIGDTNTIYLDPNQKSITPLAQTTSDVTIEETSLAWWASGLNGNINLIGVIAGTYLGINPFVTEQVPTSVNSWTFTGYRYEFDPMLRIDYSSADKDPDYSTPSQTDAKLSLVWYADEFNQGLSAGLILYNNTDNGLLAYIKSSDIVSNYDQNSNYSSSFQFDFNGVKIYLNIKFDQDVLVSGMDLNEAFDNGHWSLAITAKSMDNYIDVANSNTLSSSMGNLLDTYIQIFKLSMPSVPFLWSIVLWIVCILPLEITMIMFLSRFGILGIGAAILGNVLLTVL